MNRHLNDTFVAQLSIRLDGLRAARYNLAVLRNLPLIGLLGGCIEFGGPLVDHHDEDTTEADTGSECGPASATVDSVIDGDTVVLDSGEHVRMILVDTTEITDGPVQCWGNEAHQFTTATVDGRDVSLEYDVECEDQYGRLLAYVSVDGVEVNRSLLTGGHACLAHFPPNGDERVVEYQQLESMAERAGLGMWGACDPVPCD